MDELLQKAAEAIGMPPSLAERSAQARAEKEGTTVEAVLREWAGETPSDSEDEATDEAAAPEDTAPADDAAEKASEADTDASEPAEIDTAYLLKLAAEAKRMPEKLVLSSAEARARNAKQSVDEVLAGWAGVDIDELQAAPPPAEQAPEPEESADEAVPQEEEAPAEDEPAAGAAVATAAVAAGAAISMDELLEKVAEAKGMPAALAKRSAEARAKKTGEPLEAVLAEWAGIPVSDVVGAETAEAAEPAQAPEPEAAPETAPDAAAEEEEADDTADDVEVIEAAEPAEADDDDDSEEEPVAAARSGYPTWLAAAFVLIPLFAVAYILIAPNGPDCGTASQLKVDEATGLAVNCDGSDYGSSTVDFFAEGAALYAQCAACHGSAGEGGAGPAFSGGAVLATFPAGSCADHVEWVTLGTANWPDSTYGATDKPVGGVGVMPGYEATLTPEQIASVSLYERVQFGGQDLAEAEIDCGLVTEEGETTEAAAP